MSMQVDTYGFRVRTRRRHPLCACPVPCQARFVCPNVEHAGRRKTPYCNGAHDDLPDHCDTCWALAHPESVLPSSVDESSKGPTK